MRRASKICAACGRDFAWRKKWERCWDQVRYCSEACRRRRVSAQDRALEAAILQLLDGRGDGKTICPSEAARVVSPEGWRPLMEPARRAARRLVAQGELEICQGGVTVEPSVAKGPIRLRRPRGL